MTTIDPRYLLTSLFAAAVASAQPAKVLAQFLPAKPKGRCIVVGAGKASAAMAAALEKAWPDVPMSGIVVTRYGHNVPTSRITVIEASHPVPDANSEAAATRIMQAVRGLTPDDLVIALISGGGSALLVAPKPGLTLTDKQDINRALLNSGASIGEMNIVRKHLSSIKGGKLAAAASPATVVTLVISDVPGDDPAIIASGPTVFDATTPADALAILRRHGIAISSQVEKVLGQQEAPRTSGKSDVRLMASPQIALEAAAAAAVSLGVTPLILGDALEGEAAEAGKILAAMAMSASLHGHPARPPVVLLSGGETTVTVGGRGAGRGGRNMELLLSAAIQLAGRETIWGLAADTDGIDGTEDAAGAIITPDTLQRAADASLNPRQSLQQHDSYTFFKALGDLLMTGPTLTNVNDFRALLILPQA